MPRSYTASCAIVSAVMAAPALAHVEQMPHAHAGAVNLPLAALVLAGAAALLLLHRRVAVSRSDQ